MIHTPYDHGTGISTYIYCKHHLYKCIYGQKKCQSHASILVPLIVPFLTATALQKHSWNSRNHRTHRTPGYSFGATHLPTHLPTNHVDSHSHPKHWWLKCAAALALKAKHQIQTTNQLLSETIQWRSNFWNILKPFLYYRSCFQPLKSTSYPNMENQIENQLKIITYTPKK